MATRSDEHINDELATMVASNQEEVENSTCLRTICTSMIPQWNELKLEWLEERALCGGLSNVMNVVSIAHPHFHHLSPKKVRMIERLND
jgi:hypothetical protein